LAAPVFAQPAPEKAASDPSGTAQDEALYSCKKRTGQVAVTFKPETELKDLITWVMGFTCKNFILDPRIVSTGKKVTVIAPNKMSAQEAYNVFLAALSTMGLTIVPKGPVYRIVDSATAKSETLPFKQSGVPANQDQMVRYILRPSYTQTETLRAALDSIRSPAGNVSTAGNVIIITDYASQVRDMLTLAKALDVPGNNEGIYTIPVKNSDAQQLAQKINEILGVSAGGSGGAVNVPVRGGAKGAQPGAAVGGEDGGAAGVPSKILVDDRTNTLIVVSSEAGYMRVKALVDRLDIVLDTEGGSAIRVYPLENALAEELATTLTTVLSGQAAPQVRGQPGQPPVARPAAPAVVGGDLGSQLEGQVRVIGDKPTNSLIVMSSGRDFIAVRDVIRRLDQPRRQIFIEAVILEVQLSKSLNLGTSSHGGLPVNDDNAIVLGGVQTSTLKSINPASLATLTGLIGGIIGSPLTNSQSFLGTSIPSYAVLFQALANQDNSNILSTPHIIAIDNEKAEFSVGNNIPYKAGLSFGGLPTTAGGATSPIGSIGTNIQREKLNLTLNVTPHISSNDSVRLEIEQETKDLGGSDPELGPTWAERKLKTQVVVHDQESVVIGGLIQEREIYSVTKVPLLGDIPLLGYLFKYSTKQKKKTNLLILLTPYIIKDQLDLASIKERKVREYREFAASFANLNDKAYEPKIDYRRKRGLVEEINRAVLSVDEDRAVLEAAGGRQNVLEGAIEYGPSRIESPEDEKKPMLTPPPEGDKPSTAPKTAPAPAPAPKTAPAPAPAPKTAPKGAP
ncbi:MAG: type II secretion system secretin GspD, partial [Kofleriaceae bacterium]|nr:type II secretion system secretin GspD [Kofleriaceae bacterium]